MKQNLVRIFTCLVLITLTRAETDPKRAANIILLIETGMKNLRIETEQVEETYFKEPVFALGRIEAIPAKIATVSSTISGRIGALNLSPGDVVKAGSEVEKHLTEIEGRGQSSTVLGQAPRSGCAGEVLEILSIGDAIRPEAKDAPQLLHNAGFLKIVMHNAGRLLGGLGTGGKSFG